MSQENAPSRILQVITKIVMPKINPEFAAESASQVGERDSISEFASSTLSGPEKNISRYYERILQIYEKNPLAGINYVLPVLEDLQTVSLEITIQEKVEYLIKELGTWLTYFLVNEGKRFPAWFKFLVFKSLKEINKGKDLGQIFIPEFNALVVADLFEKTNKAYENLNKFWLNRQGKSKNQIGQMENNLAVYL